MVGVMKFRRVIIILIAAVFMLSACGDDALLSWPTRKESPPETEEPTEPQEQVQVREFVFTRDNFPRMDGSTSTVPLAEAAACVLLGEPRENVADLAVFSRTTQSFRNLAAGLCDILIVSEPSPEVFIEFEEQGFEYEMTPIATDALVFVVNASNPVDSLTIKQIQGIYTGKITNWKEVGGDDIEIAAYQRNADAGSHVMMEKLVMDGLVMSAPPMQSFPTAFGMGELISAIKGFDGSANAIGYSVFYYSVEMQMAEGLKILSVDGVPPVDDTVRRGQYPFTNPFFAVIGADEPEDSPTRVMYEWLLSEEGQALIAHEGYVSVAG